MLPGSLTDGRVTQGYHTSTGMPTDMSIGKSSFSLIYYLVWSFDLRNIKQVILETFFAANLLALYLKTKHNKKASMHP